MERLSQREIWLPFWYIVVRENFRRRHIDPEYRRAVRWALKQIREG